MYRLTVDIRSALEIILVIRSARCLEGKKNAIELLRRSALLFVSSDDVFEIRTRFEY